MGKYGLGKPADPDERARDLALALRFNHEALLNSDPRNAKRIRDYQGQGRILMNEKAKLDLR